MDTPCRLAISAFFTGTASRDRKRGNPIPYLGACHARPNCDDLTCDFVANDGAGRESGRARLCKVEVGAADTAPTDLEDDLSARWLR